eukprot:COSAG06_NODE_47605_length_338_cov_0.648536_1_plen_112_part_11
MGGMDEMGLFCASHFSSSPARAHGHLTRAYDCAAIAPDDNCLGTLYPPGSCGAFCSGHTFNCFVSEVHQACCDEGGLNCDANRDIPTTCSVGCMLVFPDFVDTCTDHIAATE